jgi:hypothetical protein
MGHVLATMKQVRDFLLKWESELIERGDYTADEPVLWVVFTRKNHQNNTLETITRERWDEWLSRQGDGLTDHWGQVAVEWWNDTAYEPDEDEPEPAPAPDEPTLSWADFQALVARLPADEGETDPRVAAALGPRLTEADWRAMPERERERREKQVRRHLDTSDAVRDALTAGAVENIARQWADFIATCQAGIEQCLDILHDPEDGPPPEAHVVTAAQGLMLGLTTGLGEVPAKALELALCVAAAQVATKDDRPD